MDSKGNKVFFIRMSIIAFFMISFAIILEKAPIFALIIFLLLLILVGAKGKTGRKIKKEEKSKIYYLSKKHRVEYFIVQNIFNIWCKENSQEEEVFPPLFPQCNWVEIEQRVIDYKKSLPEEKDEYEKEKLATNIWKEKAEQAKYQVNRVEADEVIAKIKKRTADLFAKPKPKMTAAERFQDKERRREEFIKVVKEVTKGLPPKEQDRIWAEAYQEIENIK